MILAALALIFITTPQGPMEVHADIPPWLCGVHGKATLRPILGEPSPLYVRVVCERKK